MDDLISDFVAETAESLATLDSELVRLEKDPSDPEILGNIFRLVHTVKGTCGFLGLPQLEQAAHTCENLLGLIRDKTVAVSAEVVSELLASLDAVRSILGHLKVHGTEPAADIAAGESSEQAAGNAQAQSIRVNLEVLENLMHMVGELVLVRNQLLQLSRTRADANLASGLQKLNHITSELQEGVIKTRMQPISNAWSKFPRLIRELSHELDKKIELRMIGEETELDRQLLEAIKDPLVHMIRNSADHGLEAPQERIAAGKPEIGTITLSAFHEGGYVIIEMSDDGRGINVERIKQRALKNGLATEEQMAGLTSQQIVQFIFLPGFSTAEKVTSISGRGIGMDVVRNNIEKIGGTLELSTVMGKGSKFCIKIPLTLAIVSALIVETGVERYALPQINVQEVVRVGLRGEHVLERVNDALVLRLRGTLVPVIALADILGTPAAATEADTGFIVLCRVGGYCFGLKVAHIHDIEDIVIKPNAEILKSIELYCGNAVLGDGSVILILDPNGLARATGAEDVSSTFDIAAKKNTAAENDTESFLLFMAEGEIPKAIPLELIARLEKIDMRSVETAGKQPVVQYKGNLMRLYTVGGTALPQEGHKYVIVFNYDDRNFGVVTERILDIARVPRDIQLQACEKGILGSAVINGKATDILDVAYILRDVIGLSDVEGTFTRSDRRYELLFVEDSPFFRNLTVPLLVSVGYKVTAVNNANEALRVLENKPGFDAIVSDIEMPGMDGFSLARLCHDDPRLAHIPLFAFTAYKSEQILERSRESGFTDLILKNDRASLLKSIAVFFRKEKERVI